MTKPAYHAMADEFTLSPDIVIDFSHPVHRNALIEALPGRACHRGVRLVVVDLIGPGSAAAGTPPFSRSLRREIVSPCDVDLICAPNWITAPALADAVRASEYFWRLRENWVRLLRAGKLGTALARAQRYFLSV